MGKIKNQSDDDAGMDIQQPHKIPAKKNKLIAKKSRPQSTKNTISTSTIKKKNVINQFAKKVNIKKENMSLGHKQQIFQKIIKGLQDKSDVSKRNKKKNRVLLKKELRKCLQQQRIYREKSIEQMDVDNNNKSINIKNPEKAKKKEIDQRAKSTQFHQLMGTGLQNIKKMIAKNTSHLQNKH